jgi:hypothetical membrane protein
VGWAEALWPRRPRPGTLAERPRIEPEAEDEAMSSATNDRRAGELFLVAGATFLTGTMLAASIAPGYDYHAAAISDLGVIEETAGIFNLLLIAVGALNIAGGYWYFRSHRRPGLLTLFVLGGAGAIGAGLMPLSAGAAHSLFALAGFLFLNLEAVASARLLTGPMRLASILAGAVGLLYVLVMVIGDSGNNAVFGPIGHGGTERMIVYPAMLWLLALGGHLMAQGSTAETG